MFPQENEHKTFVFLLDYSIINFSSLMYNVFIFLQFGTIANTLDIASMC